MRVAIVGSRDYPDEEQIDNWFFIHHKEIDKVVSGGARGPDTWGVQHASRYGIPIEIIMPDWEAHGKAAGFIRNKDIVEAVDWVVAFWDGVSKGTKNTIDLALRHKKALEVVFPGE